MEDVPKRCEQASQLKLIGPVTGLGVLSRPEWTGKRLGDTFTISMTILLGERHLMNKFQAMAKIMVLLNEDKLLIPGSPQYKIVRKMISDKIDRLGPDAAWVQVIDRKAGLLAQIKILCMWNKSTHRRPSTK